MPRTLDTLPGIGIKRAQLLRDQLGLVSVNDLLCFRPRRYIDLSRTQKIFECAEGEYVTVEGTIEKCEISGFKKRYLELSVFDGSGYLSVIFYGGIQYFKTIFVEGTRAVFSGKVYFRKKKILYHPEFDLAEGSRVNTGRIIPVYPSNAALREKKITSRFFRKIILDLFQSDNFENKDTSIDPLPEETRKHYELLDLHESFKNVHFPESFELLEKARRRLAFDELLSMQLFFKHQRKQMNAQAALAIKDIDIDTYRSKLPFPLTDDQNKAIEDIVSDIKKGSLINRLIQGDVGSGKTVVAFAVIWIFAENGFQSALMAPTEILANQHYELFCSLFPELRCALLCGSTPKAKRQDILQRLRQGDIELIVGTHALFQNDVQYKNLSLAVIDEQHRFGTAQRAALRLKSPSASLLVMSATPIPRSLALALYGDTDVSRIIQKPSNRLSVQTYLFDESRLEGIYRSIEKYVSQGRQCYYVLPLIEDNDELDTESAQAKYEQLLRRFPDIKISLLHGAMGKDEKISVMKEFAYGSISILVATSVIEVGIDVPNATVIVIQNAERFGLSQLHQLRGRVGRGTHQSYCVLVHASSSEQTIERLSIIKNSNDGFEIAEKDLALRGAGQITGALQSGFASDLVFASILDDIDLMNQARECADEMAAAGSDNYASAVHVSEERIMSILS